MKFPKLINVSGGTEGHSLEINIGKFTIGRALQNSYVVEDVLVSRHHCSIEFSEGRWIIVDTSFNGTTLNNNIIGKNNQCNLEHGDIIALNNNIKFKFEFSEVLPEDDDFIAVADAALESVGLSEATVQSAVNLANAEQSARVPKNVSEVSPVEEPPSTSKLEEDDLTCSVCTELFIDAVTLGCSHTFCKFCIEQWRKNGDICPICRTKIKGQFPTLIVNNLVEKYLLDTNEEDKTRRKQLIEERRRLGVGVVADTACSSTTIEITSDDDDEEEEEEEDSMEVFDGSIFLISDDWEDEYDNDDYSDYNGLPGAYYGGYGACYSCGERGHWANGCPSNPRRRRN